MILVYFASGGCVIDVVNNGRNHEFTSAIVVHFMKSTRVRWMIKRTVLNMHVCLNDSWIYEHNQSERSDEKPRHQRQFFQNIDNFHIKVFTCSFY